MKTAIIYHNNNWNGQMSAAIAKASLPEADLYLDSNLQSFNESRYDLIYVLDTVVEELFNEPQIREKIFWIDGNANDLQLYDKYDDYYSKYCEWDIATCRLVYQYFVHIKPGFITSKKIYRNNTVKEPLMVRWLGEGQSGAKRSQKGLLCKLGMASYSIDDLILYIKDSKNGYLKTCEAFENDVLDKGLYAKTQLEKLGLMDSISL